MGGCPFILVFHPSKLVTGEILRFENLVEGRFFARENRFVGIVEINGRRKKIHIHDSGRLGELLQPGARVLLLPKKTPKTEYTLIATYRHPYGWIFTNSGYHSLIAERLVEGGLLPEFRDVVGYGKEVPVEERRIDFLLEYRENLRLMEVKGCTLFEGNAALFPDAPTERGRHHLELLIKYAPSLLLFLVMSDRVRYFTPNESTDPRFTVTFLRAIQSVVHVLLPTFYFDGEVLYFRGRTSFVYPANKETLFLREVLEEVSREYNKRFSPEANATLIGIWVHGHLRFSVLFYGILCISCGLYDYFDDFALLAREFGIKAKPTSYTSFGNSFVVYFDVESIRY